MTGLATALLIGVPWVAALWFGTRDIPRRPEYLPRHAAGGRHRL